MHPNRTLPLLLALVLAVPLPASGPDSLEAARRELREPARVWLSRFDRLPTGCFTFLPHELESERAGSRVAAERALPSLLAAREAFSEAPLGSWPRVELAFLRTVARELRGEDRLAREALHEALRGYRRLAARGEVRAPVERRLLPLTSTLGYWVDGPGEPGAAPDPVSYPELRALVDQLVREPVRELPGGVTGESLVRELVAVDRALFPRAHPYRLENLTLLLAHVGPAEARRVWRVGAAILRDSAVPFPELRFEWDALYLEHARTKDPDMAALFLRERVREESRPWRQVLHARHARSLLGSSPDGVELPAPGTWRPRLLARMRVTRAAAMRALARGRPGDAVGPAREYLTLRLEQASLKELHPSGYSAADVRAAELYARALGETGRIEEAGWLREVAADLRASARPGLGPDPAESEPRGWID